MHHSQDKNELLYSLKKRKKEFPGQLLHSRKRVYILKLKWERKALKKGAKPKLISFDGWAGTRAKGKAKAPWNGGRLASASSTVSTLLPDQLVLTRQNPIYSLLVSLASLFKSRKEKHFFSFRVFVSSLEKEWTKLSKWSSVLSSQRDS